MIYCAKKEEGKDYTIYYFGKRISDLTGEVKFFSDKREPVVLKQPETGRVHDILLLKVMCKYRKEFENNNFPEKISYEC